MNSHRSYGLKTQITQIIFLVFLFSLFFSASADAGLSVSVTGGNWAIGTTGVGLTSETTTDKWTVTGSADTPETVWIKVEGTNWSPGAAAGAYTFVLKHDASGSWSGAISSTGDGIELIDLATAGTSSFDLQFTAPTSGSSGVEQTLTVILTAKE